jgi:hypothetical protein
VIKRLLVESGYSGDEFSIVAMPEDLGSAGAKCVLSAIGVFIEKME